MIEIKINTETLQNSLNAIAQRTSNTQPLMTQLARIMRNAVLDNFEAGGRPRVGSAQVSVRARRIGAVAGQWAFAQFDYAEQYGHGSRGRYQCGICGHS